jgi:glycosyltransferase involved in cell wall biosynthesis
VKIAHFIFYGPRRAGIYETTRELVQAEAELGADAKIVDTAFVDEKREPETSFRFDRGVDIATMEWAAEADVFVLHSQVPAPLTGQKPTVVALHGAPEYVFYSEIINHDRGDGGFSTILSYAKQDHMKKFVTFWKRHVDFWGIAIGDEKVAYCPAPVNMKDYSPDGEETQEFKKPGKPNVGFCDTWRPIFKKDPYQAIVGFRKFWEENKEARLHLFGIPSEKRRVPLWDRYIQAVSRQAPLFGDMWEHHPDMSKVYRGLDIVVTPVLDESRILRESLASGVPLVGPIGNSYTEYTCDFFKPDSVAAAIDAAWKDLQSKPKELKAALIDKAKQFSAKESAKAFLKVLEEVVK